MDHTSDGKIWQLIRIWTWVHNRKQLAWKPETITDAEVGQAVIDHLNEMDSRILASEKLAKASEGVLNRELFASEAGDWTELEDALAEYRSAMKGEARQSAQFET